MANSVTGHHQMRAILAATVAFLIGATSVQAQIPPTQPVVFGPESVYHLGQMWESNKPGFLNKIQDVAMFSGVGVIVAEPDPRGYAPVVDVGTGSVSCAMSTTTLKKGTKVVITGYIGSAMLAMSETSPELVAVTHKVNPPKPGDYDVMSHPGVSLRPGCTLTARGN